MSLIHYLQSWVDNNRVSKTAVRNGFRDFVAHAFDIAELRTTETQNARFVVVNGSVYRLDVTDVATSDDGKTTLVSSDGKRYKRLLTPGREVLTGARTYYVATTGSDGNHGLTAAAPFLTIQAAYDTVARTLDLAGKAVFIQIAQGTYASPVSIGTAWIGGGSVSLEGSGDPNLTILTAFTLAAGTNIPGPLKINNLRFQTGTISVHVDAPGLVELRNIVFGAVSGYHVFASAPGAEVTFTGPYYILGNGTGHYACVNGARISCNQVITLYGPAFSFTFAYVSALGHIDFAGSTISGTATGSRYYVDKNGLVLSGGLTLPGNSAGTATLGGVFA